MTPPPAEETLPQIDEESLRLALDPRWGKELPPVMGGPYGQDPYFPDPYEGRH